MASQIRRTINVIDMYHGNRLHSAGMPETDDSRIAAFRQMKAGGLHGVILKASQGLHFADNLFIPRAVAAADAGLLVGAYHFLDASDAAKQAAYFVSNTYGKQKTPAGLGLWADFEDYKNNSASLKQLVDFMKAVDADDRVPDTVVTGIYSGNRIREKLQPSKGGHQDPSMIGIEDFFQRRRLWLAQYGPRAVAPWPWNEPMVKPASAGFTGETGIAAEPSAEAPGVFLWQFTESGKFPPLPGKTDGNFFDGTFEQLQERWTA